MKRGKEKGETVVGKVIVEIRTDIQLVQTIQLYVSVV